MPRSGPIDTTAIDSAPIDIEEAGLDESLAAAFRQIGELSEELAARTAELDSLRNQQTVDQVKARILEKYVSNVFVFVSAYCSVVGVFLFMVALPGDMFELPESILGIIAGSTAVSVIGLIGLVVTGLFGGKPPAA